MDKKEFNLICGNCEHKWFGDYAKEDCCPKCKSTTINEFDYIALGSFDLFHEKGTTKVQFEDWDYGKDGLDILLAGTIWVTLSLEQAKELQAGLNQLLTKED